MKTKSNLFKRVLQNKCPNCGEGKVFKKSTGIIRMPIMFEKCEKCTYKFDREPGYFLGALYISYGFAVLQAIIAFVICYALFPSLSTFWQISIILFTLLIFAKTNFKIARILYIHIFPW